VTISPAQAAPSTDVLAEESAWLRLNALEWSPKRAHALLAAFGGSALDVWAASDLEWRFQCPGLTDKHVAQMAAVQTRDLSKEWATLDAVGAHVVGWNDPTYPPGLRPLPDAPPTLMVRGELFPEDKFSLAIVGSRRATSYGLSLAKRFARDLSAHGLTVVSGGARGVDTLAHQGALEGGGRTIAFLGCGVDVPYPADNRRLFAQIADGGGAVVSEFPMGTKPEPWRFPARNRLISGASLGTLVIESPADSGSLITAREAGDQGRDVFAIPGPIDTGRNAGCHALIQDGAKLVQSVDDILGELGLLTLRAPGDIASTPPAAKTSPTLPPEERRVLDLLTLQPRLMDSLIGESGLSVSQVSGILTLLEMKGLARRVPGNAFVRVL